MKDHILMIYKIKDHQITIIFIEIEKTKIHNILQEIRMGNIITLYLNKIMRNKVFILKIHHRK